MDAESLRSFLPELTTFLARFDDCFLDHRSRDHLPVYVSGQLSNLIRKTAEPIAKQAGVPPRTLQQFLSGFLWNHERMRDRVQQIVASEHAGPASIGLIDETSFVKKGNKTPGVQRQWCGPSQALAGSGDVRRRRQWEWQWPQSRESRPGQRPGAPRRKRACRACTGARRRWRRCRAGGVIDPHV